MTVRRTAALVAAVVLLGACGGGDGDSGAEPATSTSSAEGYGDEYGDGNEGDRTIDTAPRDGLPADGPEAMAVTFGERLAAMGLRITRSRVVEAGRAGSMLPDANHLAVYVEPVESLRLDGYIANIVPLTQLFVPAVFDRWPGVGSFDICQEPSPSEDGSQDPRPMSVVALTREQASAIDWSTVSLGQMVESSRAVPNGLVLSVDERLSRSPDWPG
jgi:hypothetical protein